MLRQPLVVDGESFVVIGVAPEGFWGTSVVSLGVVGLLLAAIGIYGVTAYLMVQRTREIGIRLALGARGSDIMAMVLRRGMTLVAIGSAIGLLLSAAGIRLLRGLLFGAPPIDPLVYGTATALFIAVGAVACYLPTRRAARIEAIEALRCE